MASRFQNIYEALLLRWRAGPWQPNVGAGISRFFLLLLMLLVALPILALVLLAIVVMLIGMIASLTWRRITNGIQNAWVRLRGDGRENVRVIRK